MVLSVEITKLEILNEITDSLLVDPKVDPKSKEKPKEEPKKPKIDPKDLKDIESSYHEIDNKNDNNYKKYIEGERIKLDFQPGDMVYVMKRNRLNNIKYYKAEFEKSSVFRDLKWDSDIKASGDTYFHFRPKPSSKLKKVLKRFISSPTGKAGLGAIGAMLGVSGLSVPYDLAKDVYKAVTDK